MHTLIAMKASLLDLRRKTNKVVEALDKNQRVTLTRRGKTFAVITPTKQKSNGMKAKDHPAFGMQKVRHDEDSVSDTVRKLRSNRYAL